MSPLQVMENLFETDDEISSEDKNCIENELSWYESEIEIDALSDSKSKTDGSDTESENGDGSVSQKIQAKWSTKPKTARKTPRQNIVTSTPDPKGKRFDSDTLLKLFQLFFDDSMLSEDVT